MFWLIPQGKSKAGGTELAWQIDKAHTSVEFAVRHMGIATVRGRFEDLEGTIDFEGGRPTRIQARIPVSTINTREPQRDAHLRSADFFDAERFPYISFVSRRVESLSGNRYRVIGDLTIRDVTREVAFEAEATDVVKDPWGNRRIGLSARGTLDRKDFGLTWNVLLEAGGLLVGDQVRFEIEVEAIEQQPATVT